MRQNGSRNGQSSNEKTAGSKFLEVRKSRVHGKGGYARTVIPKGQRIIEYIGKIVPWDEATEQEEGAHTFLFGLANGRDVIDPAVGGNDARWINHSCSPNCEAIEKGNRVFIHALRTLQPGEELFYDYGLEVDEPRTPALEKEYACHCGTSKCRGTLLGPAKKKKKKKKASRASARATKRKPRARRQKPTTRKSRGGRGAP